MSRVDNDMFYALDFKMQDALTSFYDKTRPRYIIHFIYVYNIIRSVCSSLTTMFAPMTA
jgi:hypothetical protein